MKKLVIVLLAVCLLFVAACAPAATPGPAGPGPAPTPDAPAPVPPPAAPVPPPAVTVPTVPEPGAQLAEHIDVTIDSGGLAVINPFMPTGNTGASQWTYTLIYDRLVEELGDGLYGPMLATSWSTEDYQTFVFNLREDVYFHNGEPFTAEDVAGTIRVALENLGSIGFERWRTVESWNVIDDHTIEITLASVHLDFLFDISAPAGGIIHEASFRANAEEGAWIGTGPFKVTAFSTNDFVTVERFDDYWGEAPPTRSMSLRFVPEMATRLVMLQNRESHLCFGISSEDLPILQADPDFQIIPLTMNAPNGLGFNMADPLMADPNFRRAVLHSLNLEEIAMVAAGDGARAPEDGNMWGLITPYRLNNIPRWEQNLDLAREYLAASPYAGEPVEISAGVATNIRAAEIVQHQLGQVGIDVVINAMDMASWVAYVAYGNNQSQMWINGVTFTLSPIASVTNIYLPGMGVNRTSFNNPHVTAIIEQLQGETDADTRRALFTELQEFISADPPMVNLFWRIFGIAAVNELGGLQLSPDSFRHNLRGIYMAA